MITDYLHGGIPKASLSGPAVLQNDAGRSFGKRLPGRADVFRERLAGDKAQDCLKKHRKNIKAIYTVYAADDDRMRRSANWTQ